MASETIKEFLVALGFKIDRPALENFEGGIRKASRAAVGLATAVEGMALTVGIGVARFAGNLEQLYFAARRTGSSSTSLRAFQRTAQDFGASAGEAMGSVEGLAQSMRMNPGNVALLQSLGIHLKRTKDGTYDATDALMQFGNAMRARGYFKPGEFYMAEQYARMFGINERTLLALRSGKFNAEYARIHKEMHGHGFNRATQDAHRFMNSLRNLETQLQVFGAQVEDAIQKKLGVNLKHLNAWIQKHGPSLARQLVAGAMEIYRAAAWIGEKLRWLVRKFEWFNRKTDGWAARIAAFLVVLRAIGGFEIISGVMRLAGAFATLGARILGVRTAAAGASTVSAGGLAGALVPGAILGVGAGYLLDKLFPHNWLAEAGGWMGSTLERFSHRKTRALAYFESQGWTPWQAAGIVANLQTESGLLHGATGDHGEAYGLAQWHPDRQAEFQRIFGENIRKAGFMKQLAFVNWELRNNPALGGKLLASAGTASAAGAIVSRMYERPADGAAQAARRAAIAHALFARMGAKDPILAQIQARYGAHGALAGAGGVTINQHTEIAVAGGSDAHVTGHVVAGQQRRVNEDLVRNLVTTVQ